ncbi:MAG TPA: CAP domain-containing protein [Tepidisphaeraceae bacterium]
MTRSINFFVESLESRRLRAAFSPSPAEQYAVELINRARANPVAEAQRYVNYDDQQGHVFNGDLNEGLPAGTISPDPKQPLAINPQLTDAARGHSNWMIANSTFSHSGANGSDGGARMNAAGYPAGNWGENLAINASSGTLDPTTVASQQQTSLFTDQTINLRGHRTNMMEPTRNEIGVGFVSGPYNYPGYGAVNAIVSTHDTASAGRLLLTGVAFTDAVNDDDFYTPGEGLGDITVIARSRSGNAMYTAHTWASGGYSLELPAGTYDITGSGPGLDAVIAYSGVTVDSQNVKKDFITGGSGSEGATLQTGYAKVRRRSLIAYGTDGKDVIGAYFDDSTNQYVLGINGVVTRHPGDEIKSVVVFAAAAADRVVIGAGVARSYVEGGPGKDTLIGGGGADTLYGNGGIDRIEGNGGNDVLVGENSNDLIYGGLGNDRIYGGFGSDTIDAGGGNDRVWGGLGNDEISGGKGRDYLIGEGSADTLNGNAHADTADADPDDTRIAIEVLI